MDAAQIGESRSNDIHRTMPRLKDARPRHHNAAMAGYPFLGGQGSADERLNAHPVPFGAFGCSFGGPMRKGPLLGISRRQVSITPTSGKDITESAYDLVTCFDCLHDWAIPKDARVICVAS
jgi:hypothetical protein